MLAFDFVFALKPFSSQANLAEFCLGDKTNFLGATAHLVSTCLMYTVYLMYTLITSQVDSSKNRLNLCLHVG